MSMNQWLQIPIIEDEADKASTFDESLREEKPFILLNQTMGENILVEYWLLPLGKELSDEGIDEIQATLESILPNAYTSQEDGDSDKKYESQLNSQLGTISGIKDIVLAKEIAAEIQEIIHRNTKEREGRTRTKLS